MPHNWEKTRLNDAELKALFDLMFPLGFAGRDVLDEVAPEGWEQSPLLACFHPSIEQVFNERVQFHRNIERLARARQEGKPDIPNRVPPPEPTIAEVRASWTDEPVRVTEEMTDLVGQCLWDIFSDNHDVIAPDGRIADIGSFRGASAFLDGYITRQTRDWNSGDDYRFYMGSIWISRRTDLLPVYRMIFRRLKALDADWEYQFPRLHLVDLSPLRKAMEEPMTEEYSPSESFAKEQEDREREAELEKTRAELNEIYEQSRREAMDRLPPATVRAYQEVYRRDPKGWPPVE
jgi:hypothetical protein